MSGQVGSDGAVAVGRFRPSGIAGFRARTMPNAPVRRTREAALEDERAWLDRDAGDAEAVKGD